MSAKEKVKVPEALEQLREACRNSLWTYAQTVEPHRVYSECHKDVYDWWQRCELEGIENTLALLPRDHQKSHMMAVWVSWKIYRDPTVTVLYVCATEGLAIAQLLDIKQILLSDEFQRLSPDMVKAREHDRAKWADTQIIVDHPDRVAERLRDPTVRAIGLESNVIGAHCNIMVKDDVVVDKNSLNEAGRLKVSQKAGHLSSVLTTDGIEWCVGTRYHPTDHYQDLIDMEEEVYCEDTDEIIDSSKVYAVHSRVVEIDGVFLWPRQARESDGKMFGFDRKQLSRKKAKYLKDLRNFYCQYYNDPNAINTGGIDRDQFDYYDRELVEQKGGKWYYRNKLLNLAAGVDFAYSLEKRSDWTCIIVAGVDEDGRRYVLDIDRFQTKQPSVYWTHLEALYLKWFFRHVRAEAVAAQEVIVEALKDYNASAGYNMRIKQYKPNSHSGSKDERISQTLEPLYDQGLILHYRGGMCTLLEEELIQDRPPHDDIKDTLHIVVNFDKLKAPPKRHMMEEEEDYSSHYYGHAGHSRFGGLA